MIYYCLGGGDSKSKLLILAMKPLLQGWRTATEVLREGVRV